MIGDYNSTKDLWIRLKSESRPVLLYGIGNGADKIFDTCSNYGIEILGVFASDGFVTKSGGRRRCFRGMTIMSYSEAKEKFAHRDYVILLCFASRIPEVIDNICRISEERELLVPDVPVCPDSELFTSEFCRKNTDKIDKARKLFSDSESLRIFDGIIEARLTGSLSALLESSSSDEYNGENFLSFETYRTYVDLGAYNGDTVYELLGKAAALQKIYAVEPDKKTFKRLSSFCSGLGLKLDGINIKPKICVPPDGYTDIWAQPGTFGSLSVCADKCDNKCGDKCGNGRVCEILLYNAAAWNMNGNLAFFSNGNRGSGSFRRENCGYKNSDTICTITLDSILDGQGADYIKYDVEGAEREALEGSSKTICDFMPDICLSLYHRSEDIFELPLVLNRMEPRYSLYLRRKRCLPAWEINLYAVKC